MAKFLSTFFSVIRGSIGGLTFTSNQFHQGIVRQKTAPVNPNTTKQTAARSAFSGAVAGWSTLSDADRDAWNEYAQSLVFDGPLGQYSVPGRDVFIGNIQVALFNQSQLGIPAVVDFTPPVISGFLNIESVGPITFTTPASTGISISFSSTGNEDVLAYAKRSRAFGPSRFRFKGPFLSSTLEQVVLVAPASSFMDFVGLTEDSIYFVEIRFITALAPFRLSAPFFVRTIAVTVI